MNIVFSRPMLSDTQPKKRPAVLQVGDHHHADDASGELQPAAGRRQHSLAVRHGNLPEYCRQSRCS
jgi:hypothetical protein